MEVDESAKCWEGGHQLQEEVEGYVYDPSTVVRCMCRMIAVEIAAKISPANGIY